MFYAESLLNEAFISNC